MKTARIAALCAATAATALALTACGSDNNTDSSATTAAAGTAGAASGAIACAAGTINASGSSAQKNAITQWINDYQTACPDATINYTPSGSGAGVQDFINKQTSFAGSDSALKDEDRTKADARCAPGKAIDIPMVGGAVAIAYNLDGVDSLTLDAATLAKIFSGSVTRWNDPAIAALNPGVTLPDAAIAQFHRSDSSGTTDNFTKYLKAAAGSAWTFDSGKEWKAPGGQGSKGSDGVASSVKSTKNAIGYVELSFVSSQGLKAAKVDNGSGAVEATSDAAAKTIAAATVKGTGGDLALDIDYATKEAGHYPIVLVTYQITCTTGLPADQLALTKNFLSYAASDAGQAQLPAGGYVPITGDLLTKVRAAVAALA